MRKTGLFLACGVAQAAIAMVPTSAYAQGTASGARMPAAGAGDSALGIQDIVVTARRREESLQKVPVSISVVNSADLVTKGVSNPADLRFAVPGLQAVTLGYSSNLIYAIRGQSLTATTTFPAVIPYIADVPLLRLNDGQLFDIENVQVLKGPQGTLFGRVTDGGAILISPVKPNLREVQGFAQVRVGNYDNRELEAAINVPIVKDRVALRVAGNIIRRDGYTKNIFDGADLDNLRSEQIRGTLRVQLADGLENSTIVNYSHARTNGSAYELIDINPLATGNDIPGVFDRSTLQARLAQQRALGPRTVNIGLSADFAQPGNGNSYWRSNWFVANTTTWEMSDTLTVKNIFGYQHVNEKANAYLGLGYGLQPIGDASTRREQFSNELQAQGSLIEGRLDYTIGGYYERGQPKGKNGLITALYDGLVNIHAPVYLKTTSKALYGQFSFEVVDGLKVEAGIRHTWDKAVSNQAQYLSFGSPVGIPLGECRRSGAGLPPTVTLMMPCTRFSQKSDVTTYTLGVNYQITPDVFLYATTRRGYRPGGINPILANPPVPNYLPETTTDYEIGIKAKYALGPIQFRTNLSGFIDIFKDAQRVLTVSPPGQPPYANITNQPKATIKGIELEQSVSFYNTLTLGFNWAYLDAYYNVKAFKYTPAQLAAACPADQRVTPADPSLFCPLYPIPVAPKNTYTISADLRIPVPETFGQLHIGGNLYHKSEEFNQGTGGIQDGLIPAYTLLNANVTWSNVFERPIDVTVFLTNLTNKLYEVNRVSYMDRGSFGINAALYGQPRLYGLAVKYRF